MEGLSTTLIAMGLLCTKRVWGGVGGFDADSDNEVEIDKSATLTSGGIAIDYTEHVSKRQKQSHASGHTLLGSVTDFQRSAEVQEPIEPQSSAKGKLRKQVHFCLYSVMNSYCRAHPWQWWHFLPNFLLSSLAAGYKDLLWGLLLLVT